VAGNSSIRSFSGHDLPTLLYNHSYTIAVIAIAIPGIPNTKGRC
jgi:hypothetical protein